MKLRNCVIAKLRNCETAKLRNCVIAKLRNCSLIFNEEVTLRLYIDPFFVARLKILGNVDSVRECRTFFLSTDFDVLYKKLGHVHFFKEHCSTTIIFPLNVFFGKVHGFKHLSYSIIQTICTTSEDDGFLAIHASVPPNTYNSSFNIAFFAFHSLRGT